MSHEIRVPGTLMEPARVFTDAGEQPSGFLRVLIKTAHGMPVLAVQRLGSKPGDIAAAKTKAALLRVGTQAEAYGDGLHPDHDHGTACIRLMNVTAVMPHTNHHTDPQEPSHDAA